MNLKNAEIVTVLHKNNHFAAVSVTICNKSVSEIIVYDGKKCNGVVWWSNGLRCLLKKIGYPHIYMNKARKYSSTDFSGVDFILQSSEDNSNCGPIAAMVVFNKFLPEEIDYQISVNQFRGSIIKNLLHILV